jgi:peptidoglycan/LPS O-acetylase OafA/YrhL
MVPFKLHFPYLSQLTLAAASAVLMWVLLGDRRAARERALDTRLARGSARFSYTLYIVHMPALVLLSILVGSGNGNWYPDARHLAWGAALLGLVVLYSWLVSLATEAHTDKVRRWVEQTLP